MLEHFFGSKTRLKLLKIFFKSPGRPFYVRELARLAETQLNAVRREIANLELLTIIRPVSAGELAAVEPGTERSKYYQTNLESLLYPELKALLLKAELVEEQHLVDELRSRAGTIKLFLLTGQFMHDSTAETDIFLVGDIKPTVVEKIIHGYELEQGKTIRYTIMDEKEYHDRREIGDKFLYAVFEAKHMFVINSYQS